jgi:hypothetical protein
MNASVIVAGSDIRLMETPTARTSSVVDMDISAVYWGSVIAKERSALEVIQEDIRKCFRYHYWFHHKGKRPKRGNPCRHH